MNHDNFSNSIRQAFAVLRMRRCYAPILLRTPVPIHEDPDPDWQPL